MVFSQAAFAPIDRDSSGLGGDAPVKAASIRRAVVENLARGANFSYVSS